MATGFEKWGMTHSLIAARLIGDLVDGKPNDWESLYSPQRLLLRASAANLLKDASQSIVSLTAGLLSRKQQKCPHLKCRLHENAEDGTWECPCHGSRFLRSGTLLNGPAQTDK